MTPAQKSDADELPHGGAARAFEIAGAIDRAFARGVAEGERRATARIVAALRREHPDVADYIEAGRL